MTRLIEPLRSKLWALVRSRKATPLSHARSLYGTHDDLTALQVELNSVETREVPLVDLSPFLSIGTPARQQNFLDHIQKRQCVFAIPVSLATATSVVDLLAKVPTVVVDDQGKVKFRSESLKRPARPLRDMAARLEIGASFFSYRAELVAESVRTLLDTAIRLPPAGRRYVRLSDDTSANVWLDVKSIVRNTESAFTLAYHIGYALTLGYRSDLPEDGFVVGNNTSYVIACLLQMICDDKEVIVVDRLGPYPHLTPLRLMGYERHFKGKQFCIVEDVISTGREIDLITMASFFLGGTVTRAVALFDFEVGSSLLLSASAVHSIVKPTTFMEYVRVPKSQREAGE